MNQKDNQTSVAAPNSWHMIRAMGGIGLLCGLLIVMTYEATLPIIDQKKAEYLEKAIFVVLPDAASIQPFEWKQSGEFAQAAGVGVPGRLTFAGYDQQNNLVGIAVDARGQGFQDVIRILYGYSFEKQAIIGFVVLESKETPGLGDKIEKDENFLRNFEALDVSLTPDGSTVANPIVAVKNGTKTESWQLDAITGATISSNAIATILQKSTAEWMPALAKNKTVFEK